MTWDYRCETCGGEEERSVMAADRDQQVCRCGAPLARVPAFTSQLVVVPEHFRHSLDEYGPSKPSEEKIWRDMGWRPKGEPWWRNAALDKTQRGIDPKPGVRKPAPPYTLRAAYWQAKKELAKRKAITVT